jgi:hypothetical protein
MTDTVTNDPKSLIGPKILLEGPSGTGKTYAIGKLVDWAAERNIEVFVLFTENGLETLLGCWADVGKEVPPNLHYHMALTKPISLAALKDGAEKVGKFTYEMLTKMVDAKRGDNNAFYKIIEACADFPDDRTGKKFGPVDSWGTDRIFVIDSLSELANACMKAVIGNKPTAAQNEYGVAQNSLMNFLRLCTQGLSSTFVLTAHVDRQTDELTGATKIMTRAIGKALANDIPQLFSDAIFTVREGSSFYWDTANPSVDVKTRNLPIQSKLPPDFGQIMDKWAARNAAQLK